MDAPGCAEIHCHATFVTRNDFPPESVALLGHPVGSGGIADRVLDLHDVSIEVAQQLCGDRRRVDSADVEHPRPVQRPWSGLIGGLLPRRVLMPRHLWRNAKGAGAYLRFCAQPAQVNVPHICAHFRPAVSSWPAVDVVEGGPSLLTSAASPAASRRCTADRAVASWTA